MTEIQVGLLLISRFLYVRVVGQELLGQNLANSGRTYSKKGLEKVKRLTEAYALAFERKLDGNKKGGHI